MNSMKKMKEGKRVFVFSNFEYTTAKITKN